MFTKMILACVIMINTLQTPEQKDAINNYREYKLTCTPNTLKQDSIFLVNDKDTTWCLQKDLNGILWVSKPPQKRK